LGFVPVPVVSINTRQSIEMNAFSANDTISFFDDRLSLLGGIRHQKSSQILRNLDRYHGISGALVGAGSVSIPPDVSQTTPMYGVSFQLTESLNAYSLVSESFVPQFGTAKNESGDDFPLKPIIGESFEVGVKVSSETGRYSATVAYFDITNKNRSRFGGLIATGPFIGQSYTIQTNAEKATGVELDGVVRPTKNWQILVGYAYTDSKIADPLFAEPVSLIDPNSPRDLRIPGVPVHQLNLLQKYTFTDGPLKGFAANFGANYQSDRRGSESAQEVISIPDVWLFDAGLFYTTKVFGRRTELRLAVSNLFNKKYVTTGPFLGDPLTYRFSIRTQF
jgi:iron complex outermembrane receptor protein